MKEEVEAKNYGEYILSKREEGFREYVKMLWVDMLDLQL